MAAPIPVAESKIILLCDGKLSEADTKILTQHLVTVRFDPLLHSSTDLESLMRRFQLLILDISDPKAKRYWVNMRGFLTRYPDWICLYKLQKGKETNPDLIDTLKTRFSVRHVVKYLPEGARTVAELVARISDHIPSNTSCLGGLIKKVICA